MEGTIYCTKEAVLKRAEEAIGIPLRDIDKTGRLATGKGAIGTVIEESWYGYAPNSEAEPDFPEAGVELKVTPYLRRSGKLRAKERLVCNIIDYMTEWDKTLETSAFWHKCQTMLLMSYEHLDGVPKGDYTIDKAVLFSFPVEDAAIIEHDWETIMAKVRRGEAHLISEGDTMYLAACTKGANAKSVREQPFSETPAKQRAYSLKSSYMTHILNAYIFGSQPCEQIVKDWRLLRTQTFEEYVTGKVQPYLGRTQAQLKAQFGVETSAKNLNEVLLARMLEVKGKIAYTDEFQKANIVPKTIRVRRDGTIRESMSFPTFDFIELSRETWEESTLREYLEPTKFLFIIFQENDRGAYVFDRIQFWNIPEEDLEEVHRVWEQTVQTICRGVRLLPTPRGVANDLPGQAQSRVAHVRPHSAKSFYVLKDGTKLGSGTYSDAGELPDGRWMTKQCFWLNNTYVAEQVKI